MKKVYVAIIVVGILLVLAALAACGYFAITIIIRIIQMIPNL